MGNCPKCGCDDILLFDIIDSEVDLDSDTLWEKRAVTCNDCKHEFLQVLTADITNVKVETW